MSLRGNQKREQWRLLGKNVAIYRNYSVIEPLSSDASFFYNSPYRILQISSNSLWFGSNHSLWRIL